MVKEDKKKTVKKVSKEAVDKKKKSPRAKAEKKGKDKLSISKTKTETKRPEKKSSGTEKYIEAVGRRKTAVARIRLWTKGGKEFLINGKKYQDYFPNFEMQKIILDPLEMMKSEDKFKVSVKVKGSGKHSQAEAVRHGLSRALIKFNPEFRKRLKKAGFLTRDPRMRERKKFGLKRARRAPQWSKR